MGAIRYCDMALVTENSNKRLSNAPNGRLRIGKKNKISVCDKKSRMQLSGSYCCHISKH